jgi:hypothetical protein
MRKKLMQHTHCPHLSVGGNGVDFVQVALCAVGPLAHPLIERLGVYGRQTCVRLQTTKTAQFTVKETLLALVRDLFTFSSKVLKGS